MKSFCRHIIQLMTFYFRPPTSNGIDSKYLQKTNEAETKIASSRAPLASAYFPSK